MALFQVSREREVGMDCEELWRAPLPHLEAPGKVLPVPSVRPACLVLTLTEVSQGNPD